MSKKHARLSPSSADRWTDCTASPMAQDGIPNTNSDASRQGTTCHQMQEEVLLDASIDLQSYLGRQLAFWEHPESSSVGETWLDTFSQHDYEVLNFVSVEVTQAMVDAVAVAVAFIREQHTLLGGEMLVEQRVPVGQFTGEDDAAGSADVILMGADWIHVMDSKFGRKRVNASRLVPGTTDVKPNLQMACYALGAVHKHDVLEMVERVTMTIVQPFINHTDSFTCSLDELRETEAFLRERADETRENPQFKPSFSNCFFCRAKGPNCDAQSNAAMGAALDGFEDVVDGDTSAVKVRKPDPLTLGTQYELIDFVRRWADDVEAAVRIALDSGEPVVNALGQHYKLVAGKATPRQWRDPVEAEAALKKLRLKQSEIYSLKVISPTQAESLSKPAKVPKGATPPPPVIGPRQWENLKGLIVRGEGAPVVTLETDPKPALVKATGFEDVPTQDTSFADLFGE